MCKAPKPPKPKEPKKPQFLRNRYLDEFVGGRGQISAIRTGRSSLRIPTGGPAPIGGRNPGDSLVAPRPNGDGPTSMAPRGLDRPAAIRQRNRDARVHER